jgi:hypothetical protein
MINKVRETITLNIDTRRKRALDLLDTVKHVDGARTFSAKGVVYHDPRRLRATAVLNALGFATSEQPPELRRKIDAAMDMAERVNNAQADTVLKCARMGWVVSYVKDVGGKHVEFELAAPNGAKSVIKYDGSFVRMDKI